MLKALLTIVFYLTCIAYFASASETNEEHSSVGQPRISWEDPIPEELGINVPSDPTFYMNHFFSRPVDELYRMELVGEATLDRQYYDLLPTLSHWIRQVNTKVSLRLAKQIIEKTQLAPRSKKLQETLRYILSEIDVDEDIQSVLETEGLEPAMREGLLARLSPKGTMIRHVRDGNIPGLERMVEKGDEIGQVQIDAAFEEATMLYQKAAEETFVDVAERGALLEWIAERASEQAVKDMQPRITRRTMSRIGRGRKKEE